MSKQHDLSLHQQALQELFPNISKWETNTEGFDHVVFIANETVVRMPWFANYKGSAILEREYAFLQKFGSTFSMQTPRMQIHRGLAGGLTAVSYPYLKGSPLLPASIKELSDDAQTEIARQLGVFLTELHSLSVAEVAAIGYEVIDPSDYADYISDMTDRYNRTGIFEKTGYMEQILSLTADYIHSVRTHGFEVVVNHSDMQPEHILRDDSGILSVIDFGDIRINDPAYDFTFINHYPDIFRSAVLRSYTRVMDSHFQLRMLYHGVRHIAGKAEQGRLSAKNQRRLEQLLLRYEAPGE
ncbi:MAG: Bifunctional AAC/APH [candidate division WS6 bacterium OLB20]|uniref:Bifunctional AAC/APH n=1 Tax=candidate division WS6 bacterium OLB20 TaxID=1617426 RepID=A0A136LZH5_9BACT|nr:MAG: Bifunctional AAC/APH [candidate division WS6 bacterium OLB20]